MDAIEHHVETIRNMPNSVSSFGISDREAKASDKGSSVILPEISELELKAYIENINPLYKQDTLFSDMSEFKP
ncbi:hypothetical protein PGTUg99_014171 [Puccinia graminis f. sp. tritici]|nr:hypothetical protein PGTUg99_014171 [Puccinia graminis f. sp. tritici]